MFKYKNFKLVAAVALAAMFHLSAQAKVIYTPLCPAGSATGLPVCKWQESTIIKPRAVILVVHGLTQRAYSMNELASKLAGQGFIVFGITQRGHGSWHYAFNKGTTGYNCDFKGTVKDIKQLIPVLRDKYPGLPFYMIGESIGAAIVLRSATQVPNMVNGIILCSCGTKREHFKTRWILGDIFSSIYRPRRQIDITRYKMEYANDDSNVIKATLKDPLVRRTLSGIEILQACSFIQKNAKFARRLDPDTSLLVVQGGCDHVVNPKSATKVVKNAASRKKSLLVVQNCGHMLIGRPNIHPLVTSAINSWLINDLSKESLAYSIK